MNIVARPDHMQRDWLKLLQARTAMISIDRSTLRNQGARDVVGTARQFLARLDLQGFRVKSEACFYDRLEEHTQLLKTAFPVGAQNWGTARKGLNVFLRDVLYNTLLCNAYGLANLEPWLEVPLDSYVYDGLKGDAPPTVTLPPWPTIKRLTRDVSSELQQIASAIAAREHLARVHLDLKYWRNDKLPKVS